MVSAEVTEHLRSRQRCLLSTLQLTAPNFKTLFTVPFFVSLSKSHVVRYSHSKFSDCGGVLHAVLVGGLHPVGRRRTLIHRAE